MSTNLPPDRPYSWFDPLYEAADGDASAIPWAYLEPCPWVIDLVDEAPNDGRTIVVGCGLGDDAEALADAGHDTIAFDVSPAAVDWCRRRFPDSAVDYRVADLFDLPDDLVASGDLVVEVRTIQSLPPSVRSEAIEAVAALVAPGGLLLVVALARPDGSVPTGPPWPVSPEELAGLERAGLTAESSKVDRGQFVNRYRR